MIYLLTLIEIPLPEIHIHIICDILSKVEHQYNLHYGESVLMKYNANLIIYEMIQNSKNNHNKASAINILAEMIDCDNSTTLTQLIRDDNIIQYIQNPLNKIANSNEIKKSALKILIASSSFILNLSQQTEDIYYSMHQLNSITNIMLCIFNCIFKLLLTTHESKLLQIQINAGNEMLENITCCMINMYKNQYQIIIQLLSKMLQNNEYLLYQLMNWILYQESVNVRHNILEFVSNFVRSGNQIEINIFKRYGLLLSIKRLLLISSSSNTQNGPSKDKELSYILDIISNLLDFSKFADDYIADIIADDDILHCINNALTSKQMNQCCNAVFAVNNILTFPDKTWLFYLIYWQQGCMISRFIDACKYLINNFSKLKYDYELRKRIGKRRIGKLSEIILKMNHNDTFNIKQIDLQSLR